MSRRIERVNALFQEKISELLQRDIKDPRLHGFVTITCVSTSADLRHAKVFVSIMGSEDEKRGALAVLTAAAGFFRKELAENVKLRRIPELSFHRDDSIEQGSRLLQLIEQITTNKTEIDR